MAYFLTSDLMKATRYKGQKCQNKPEGVDLLEDFFIKVTRGCFSKNCMSTNLVPN